MCSLRHESSSVGFPTIGLGVLRTSQQAERAISSTVIKLDERIR